MSVGAAGGRPLPAVFQHGFRPFFLGGALWAAGALALWMAALHGTGAPASALPPLVWHGHAMVYGFGLAIVAGFLLTAVPNWTATGPLRGAPLAGLAGLWLLGRAVMTLGGGLPVAVVAATDMAFGLVLLGWVARVIVGTGNWRNLPVLAALGVLVAGNAVVHVQTLGMAPLAGAGNRLGIAAIALLATLIGGRIVPAFTRNWLRQTGRGGPYPAEPDDLDRLGLVTAAAALAAWVGLGAHPLTAVLAGCAAVLTAVRLARWRGWRAHTEPLLWVLHLGYAWLPVGFGLIALHAAGAVPATAALHALTAGLMGTLMLAMMTRVPRGHTGRPLRADAVTAALYGLVIASGLLRVVAGMSPALAPGLMGLSAAAWIAAFGGYALSHAPMLLTARAE
ncbi:uncharacterized protein involved in response to NO [Limimonas halophila]|uniref:Uncharacterized protein involved in response to NO n=1 Tax=Limimonas halophila TaxID=1082479 RepID=A0A1G7QRD6_9PROT|nr:NnrS family protein [Limimonas halophila]SDG01075.1 uncharacterized protein involved in response to NO [Limimonas halophila]